MPAAAETILSGNYADTMTASSLATLKRTMARVAVCVAAMGFLGSCSSEKKPIDVITSDGVSQDSDVVDETVITEDTGADVPSSLVALIKKTTGVEDTIGECVGGNLMDAYGIEKASKIAALPESDTSDDRSVLDQAVLDCRG
jgi:hypothetical protein